MNMRIDQNSLTNAVSKITMRSAAPWLGLALLILLGIAYLYPRSQGPSLKGRVTPPPTPKKITGPTNRPTTKEIFGENPKLNRDELDPKNGNTDLTAILSTYRWGKECLEFQDKIIELIKREESDPAYLQKHREENGDTPLLLAVKADSLPVVKALLPHYSKEGLCHYTQPYTNNALHIALAYGKFEIAKALYDRAVELNCVQDLVNQKNCRANKPFEVVWSTQADQKFCGVNNEDHYIKEYFHELLSAFEVGESRIARGFAVDQMVREVQSHEQWLQKVCQYEQNQARSDKILNEALKGQAAQSAEHQITQLTNRPATKQIFGENPDVANSDLDDLGGQRGNTDLTAVMARFGWGDLDTAFRDKIIDLIKLEKIDPVYLQKHNEDDQNETRNTPLMLAVKADSLEVVQALLLHYSKEGLCFQTPRGNNALHIALAYGKFEIAKALYEKARHLGCLQRLMNTRNKNGHMACEVIWNPNTGRICKEKNVYEMNYLEFINNYFDVLLAGHEVGHSRITEGFEINKMGQTVEENTAWLKQFCQYEETQAKRDQLLEAGVKKYFDSFK